MKRCFALFLGLAILLPLGALARPGGFHGVPGLHLERALEQLDLDASTWEQIDAILDAAMAEKEPLREEIRAAHEEMRMRMEADPPDLDVILSQTEVIGALHVEAHKQRLQTWFAVRAVLTSDQIDALAEIRRNRHAGFRRGHEHRENGGPETDFDR
ncbi:MAG: periplasmic heavy metal sensor [Myxococcota bacterium]|jgi:Spy/CpxP family protein refolding chaperone|nr:hypothetical protein [Deltaproteobacteria bacterium]MCP4241766.1 periplasmic heavy metal sensor [bacterium]MDP6075968.1 periplasmic heavy metal sensor [Myxococcota bacterium]MDP6242351.1 periplasmic heavy metal sensor [Myxococcota bacterium]MDP7076046.1 periplasmic heavy metal sensor [Myxococcota bacterium]